MKSERGKLITFEGIEGSGKSTHARLAAMALRSAGCKVVEVREPGGTRLGETIRRMLRSKGHGKNMNPRTELLLFMASRAQLVSEVILPALERGEHVICDRFSDSTSAYQGYARGCDLGLISRVNTFAVQGLVPDLTILLDLDVVAGFKRLGDRNRRLGTAKDRIESEGIDFHRRVRSGYLDLARRAQKRFVVIRAGRPLAGVQAEVWKAVRNVTGI